jgi:hypothetical protein
MSRGGYGSGGGEIEKIRNDRMRIGDAILLDQGV